jgi:hypothetical protein
MPSIQEKIEGSEKKEGAVGGTHTEELRRHSNPSNHFALNNMASIAMVIKRMPYCPHIVLILPSYCKTSSYVVIVSII